MHHNTTHARGSGKRDGREEQDRRREGGWRSKSDYRASTGELATDGCLWTEILMVGAVAFMRTEINSQLPVNFRSIARDTTTIVLSAINASTGTEVPFSACKQLAGQLATVLLACSGRR